jgi:4-hydroxyphenylacetate 3-monooxygenase
VRDRFETWSVPGQSAKDRMKLFKLAWDLLGSDFAGRHAIQKFYAGPGFVMNSTATWPDRGKMDGAGGQVLATTTAGRRAK